MARVVSFTERCMQLRLTDQDRARILMRSRVNTDEVIKRYPTWDAQFRASDEMRAQAEQQWALLRAQRAARKP